jgi:CheY-like chemotaxis protein
MANTWRVLHVDDEQDILTRVKEYLEGEELGSGDSLEVDSEENFSQALDHLEAERFDLVILDVRLGEGHGADDDAGLRVIEDIQSRRFVPIIFYTAIPGHVEHLKSPLIAVVEKTTGLPALLETVKVIIDRGLPSVNRALLEHVDKVQREYMWGFVSENWDDLGANEDKTAVAQLLARRLAMSLAEGGVDDLIVRLGGEPPPGDQESVVSPIRYYIIPPVSTRRLVGDVLRGTIDGVEGYWVLLTPSCDLARDPVKAEWVLLAPCGLLTETDEYKEWSDNQSGTKTNALKALLRNEKQRGQKERYFFLPGVLKIPDLVVDLQHLHKLGCNDLGGLEPIASLDSPFAEYLVTRFTRYWGRLGVPDLNVDLIMERLKDEK